MKNLKGKGLLTILLVLTLLVTSASSVFASFDSFLALGNDGKYYEYNADALDYSHTAYALNPASPAAAMYAQLVAIGGPTKIVAFHDSVTGYMDAAATQAAYVQTQILEQPWDMNAYLASAAAVVYPGTVTAPGVVNPDGTVTATADLTAYNAAKADAATKVEADYTAASWATLQTALATVITPASTQAEVDAAAGAINAAILALEPVPTTPSVAGVSATSATTLTVTFDKAISAADQALITFDVKRGTTATTMLAPVWAADGLSVDLARSTNLVAGTYTVTATGIEFTTNAATTTVTAQTATALEITTSRVRDAAAQSVGYVVTDQYGDEMTVAPALLTVTTSNLTNAARAVTGATPLVIDDLNFSPTDLNDVVRVTAYLTSNPAITAVKDVTVSNITLGTVTLGEPVLPEGETRFETGLAGVVIPVTAVDNFGEATELTTEAWASATATTDGLYPVFANPESFTSVAVNADGDLVVTLGDAGTATLTVTNPATGVVVTKTITVVALPDTATVAMTLPEDPIRIGTDSVIPFTVTDQFGEALTVPGAGWANTDVTLASSNGAVATVAWNANEITVHPLTEGTTTIFANVVTPVSTGTASLVITVEEGKVPTVISVSGTPKTALAQGETVAADAETGALAFTIVDQDGDPIDLTGGAGAGIKANLTVTDANSVLAAPAAQVLTSASMSATDGLTNGIAVTAAAVNGTATVQVQLFNDTADFGTMNPGEELDSQADVVYTVSTQALTAGEISTVAPGVLNEDGTAAYAAPAATQTLTYGLLDQAGNVFTATAATNIVWTVKNNGTTDITVNDGTDKTLAAGATATYTTIAAIGDTSDTITVSSADAKKVDVSAKAAGVATASDLALYFYDALVNAVSTYSGTVVAVDTDAQWMVVQTAVGNVVLSYADVVTFDGAIAYTVNGSTATEAQLDDNLSVGDTVNIAVVDNAGALDLTVQLTNH